MGGVEVTFLLLLDTLNSFFVPITGQRKKQNTQLCPDQDFTFIQDGRTSARIDFQSSNTTARGRPDTALITPYQAASQNAKQDTLPRDREEVVINDPCNEGAPLPHPFALYPSASGSSPSLRPQSAMS